MVSAFWLRIVQTIASVAWVQRKSSKNQADHNAQQNLKTFSCPKVRPQRS